MGVGFMNCEQCVYYVYDEEYEDYTCLANMDEDEYIRFVSSGQKDCPFFRLDDEYAVVRKQN